MTKIVITAEYGRKLEISESTASEWLDDLAEGIDETMSQPLRIGDRFAFCAPEVIRSAIATEILRGKIVDREMETP